MRKTEGETESQGLPGGVGPPSPEACVVLSGQQQLTPQSPHVLINLQSGQVPSQSARLLRPLLLWSQHFRAKRAVKGSSLLSSCVVGAPVCDRAAGMRVPAVWLPQAVRE